MMRKKIIYKTNPYCELLLYNFTIGLDSIKYFRLETIVTLSCYDFLNLEIIILST